jgi:hypothetical protein
VSRHEKAVVGEPPDVFHVPVAEAVNCLLLVIDSNRTGLWAAKRIPEAPKPVPSKEKVSTLSCCGESGPATQVLGGVGMSGHPRHNLHTSLVST